jgi:hypothetical protein
MILVFKIAWSLRGVLLVLLSFLDMVRGWIEALGISIHDITTWFVNVGTSIIQWMF